MTPKQRERMGHAIEGYFQLQEDLIEIGRPTHPPTYGYEKGYTQAVKDAEVLVEGVKEALRKIQDIQEEFSEIRFTTLREILLQSLEKWEGE